MLITPSGPHPPPMWLTRLWVGVSVEEDGSRRTAGEPPERHTRVSELILTHSRLKGGRQSEEQLHYITTVMSALDLLFFFFALNSKDLCAYRFNELAGVQPWTEVGLSVVSGFQTFSQGWTGHLVHRAFYQWADRLVAQQNLLWGVMCVCICVCLVGGESKILGRFLLPCLRYAYRGLAGNLGTQRHFKLGWPPFFWDFSFLLGPKNAWNVWGFRCVSFWQHSD